MPDLPVEVWAYIMDILEEQRRHAATVIEAHFRGYKMRIGPLRRILRYICKGRLVQRHAPHMRSPSMLQARGRPHAHIMVWADLD